MRWEKMIFCENVLSAMEDVNCQHLSAQPKTKDAIFSKSSQTQSSQNAKVWKSSQTEFKMQ